MLKKKESGLMKLLKEIKNTGSLCLLFLLIGYYMLVKYTGFSLPCPFRAITGLLCPGCGITTMFLALAEGNATVAKQANVFLYYTLPAFVLLLLVQACWRNVKLKCLLDKFILPLYAVALLIFGIWRNL